MASTPLRPLRHPSSSAILGLPRHPPESSLPMFPCLETFLGNPQPCRQGPGDGPCGPLRAVHLAVLRLLFLLAASGALHLRPAPCTVLPPAALSDPPRLEHPERTVCPPVRARLSLLSPSLQLRHSLFYLDSFSHHKKKHVL